MKVLSLKKFSKTLVFAKANREKIDFFQAVGLHRLRGTIRYPGTA